MNLNNRLNKKSVFTKNDWCKIYSITDKNPPLDTTIVCDYVQLWLVRKGSCVITTNGKSKEVSKGEIILTPPGVSKLTEMLDSCEIICCDFSYEMFFHKENDVCSLPPDVANNAEIWNFLATEHALYTGFKPQTNIYEKIKKHMINMWTEYDRADIHYQDLIKIELMALLILLTREYKKSPLSADINILQERYKPMMERTIAYIEQNYSKNLTLEEVCKVSTVSKTYFSHIFKAMTHRTFIEYLTELRIQHAVELLKDPTISVTAIGFEVGFNDATHFSRTFKKLQGVSPRNCRIQMNNARENHLVK